MSETVDNETTEMWKARELADSDSPPDISFSRFLWLFRKTWPFMWPMRWHILAANIIFPIIMIAVGTLAGVLTGDLWFNKILNGQRLTDAQAFFFFVDDDYINYNSLANEAMANGLEPPSAQRFSLDVVSPPLEESGYSDLTLLQNSARERIVSALRDELASTVTIEVRGPSSQKAGIIEPLAGVVNRALESAAAEDLSWDQRMSDPFWAGDSQTVSYLRVNARLPVSTPPESLQTSIASTVEMMDISNPVVLVTSRGSPEILAWLPTDELVLTNKVGDINLGELILSIDGITNVDQFRSLAVKVGESLDGIRLNGFEMSHQERSHVRNVSLGWFLLGAIFGVVVELLFMAYYQSWVWQNVIHHLRVRMIEQVEKVSLQFHNDSRAGDAIYRVNQDSNQINSALEQVIIGPLMTLYNLLIAVAFVVGFAPFLMWVLIATMVPMLILTYYYTPRLRRKSIANRVANSELTSRLQETFAANKIVKANRAENIVLARFRNDSRKALDAALGYRLEMIVLSMLVAFIGGLAIIGLEYAMVGWVIENERTYLGAAVAWLIGFTLWNLGAFEAARGRIEQVVGTQRHIVRWWSMLQDLFIGLERAFYFIDLAPAVSEQEAPQSYPAPIHTVRWHDVHFDYGADNPVLRGVNLEARVGTMTAVVGQTGSGKSTMMSMLLRLYDPKEGRITVNDLTLPEMKLDEVRSNCAIALQKNILFTGKVHDNIAYAVEGKTREDVEEAARIACAADFIGGLEFGYDTELGERGSKLSAGQRQRLSIARAVLRNTPILILDEPTASLDARTEQQVLANLAEWGHDKVVFIITHRLSTIRSADQIAVLRDGVIAEVGQHEQLIANPESAYSRFVQAETEGTGETLS